jgi:dienelactone hydrolase
MKERPSDLHDFLCEDFAHAGITRPVWWSEARSGAGSAVGPDVAIGPGGTGSGGAVLVCHELPGPSPAFLGFVRHLREAGFRVVVPHLLGHLGRGPDLAHMARGLAEVCISGVFRALARDAESPISGWLRALASAMASRYGVTRVGAIGMCLTGNFALGLLLNPVVARAVACQPSLPLALTPVHAAALHLAPEAVRCIAGRLADPSDPAAALALRFRGDPLCPEARFAALRRAFPENLTLIELPPAPASGSAPGSAAPQDRVTPGPTTAPRRAGHPFAHATLTLDLDPTPGSPTSEARARVVAFLREGLGG